MEEIIFDDYWELFAPDPEFANRRAATQRLWEQCVPDRRRAIIDWLKAGNTKCTRNPYFFVLDFRAPRKQTLTYAQYYAKFGTTEPRDGWHMANPTGNKVIYEKN
jgi:hypothetical protein